MCWGPGARWRGLARAGLLHTWGLVPGVLACAGGLWRAGGSVFPDDRRGRACAWGGVAVCALSPGFLFAGLLAVANAMFYFALTWLEYTGCEHMRA